MYHHKNVKYVIDLLQPEQFEVYNYLQLFIGDDIPLRLCYNDLLDYLVKLEGKRIHCANSKCNANQMFIFVIERDNVYIRRNIAEITGFCANCILSECAWPISKYPTTICKIDYYSLPCETCMLVPYGEICNHSQDDYLLHPYEIEICQNILTDILQKIKFFEDCR